VTAEPDLLARLETYYDTAPRATADTEEHGPLTLFVAREGWPYYARPRLGVTDAVTAEDVRLVLARQRELDVPRAVEWVHEMTPSLLDAAREAGMEVEECPLLVLDGDPVPRATEAAVRVVPADDPALGLVRAAISVGFANDGTARGEASVRERDADAAQNADAAARATALIEAGRSVLVGAFDAHAGPVGGGSHSPRGEVTEIVGVGVLPAFRRRGVAGALTYALAQDAISRGVTTVFCGAQDEDVARVYAGAGFRRVGTACIAEAD
jgi:GNAT superfamily N-acetyltransferase